MTKSVNVIYYVDVDDNTKASLCAIPSDIDMRLPSVIEYIAETISDTFSKFHALIEEHKIEIAKGVAYHKTSNIGEYEFGVEEVTLFEL